jgi:predicted dehydrogenase
MAHSDRVRCAVIGAGGFAEACHVPGLQSHPRAEVVLLCGRNEERRRGIAERLGVPETVGDYREVVSRADIDAVTITTPNVSHREIAMAALAAGKHVFCEKPLAMNGAEAEAMAQMGRESGRIHQIAFTFRYTHGVARLRELLREGAIGQPFFVRMVGEGWSDLRPEARVAWRHQVGLAGAGMLADMGSHYFDLVNWAVGPVAEVCGMLHTVPRTRPDAEGRPTRVDSDDLAHVWFRTAAGVQGEFRSSRITPSHGDSGFMEVVGDQGALVAVLSRGSRDELRLLRPSGAVEEVLLPEESRSGETYALGRMMRGFVESILRGRSDSDLDPTFDAGLAAQRAQDAVLRSVETRAWAAVKAKDDTSGSALPPGSQSGNPA